jgi:hypothetical protein
MPPMLVNDKDPKENPKSEYVRDNNKCIEELRAIDYSNLFLFILMSRFKLVRG